MIGALAYPFPWAVSRSIELSVEEPLTSLARMDYGGKDEADGATDATARPAIKGGFTVWKMKAGTPSHIHVPDLNAAIKECLK